MIQLTTSPPPLSTRERRGGPMHSRKPSRSSAAGKHSSRATAYVENPGRHTDTQQARLLPRSRSTSHEQHGIPPAKPASYADPGDPETGNKVVPLTHFPV